MENWLLIIVTMIFVVCIVVGASRGFLKISLSLFSTILLVTFISFLNPYVSNALAKYTPIQKTLEKKCKIVMFDKFSNEMEEQKNPELLTLEGQIRYIEEMYLPSFIKERLIENNNTQIYKELGVEAFTDFAVAYMARMALRIISFLIAFFVSFIAVRILLAMAGIIGMIPVIGGINRIIGMAAGFAIAILIVWVLFLGLTVMNSTDLGRVGIQMINESKWLSFLYEHNILLHAILKF